MAEVLGFISEKAGRLGADCDDGSVLTCLDAFVAAYAGFGVLDDDVLVKAKELIDLAKNLFRTSL